MLRGEGVRAALKLYMSSFDKLSLPLLTCFVHLGRAEREKNHLF